MNPKQQLSANGADYTSQGQAKRRPWKGVPFFFEG
jgi:hypothetical protein